MGAALLVCRLALAGVFAIAGGAKLGDLAGSRQAMTEFGLPARLARTAGVLLPAVELGVAVALIPVATARFGALTGILVLAAFTAAIARALARGRSPHCHCFGQLHSASAGWGTLARNGTLLATAGFVAIAGWNGAGDSATHWLTRTSVAWLLAIGASAAAVLQIGLVLRLRRQNALLRARVSELEAGGEASGPGLGLPVGAPAPQFELEDVGGERHPIPSRSGPLLLVFVDARCAPCDLLMPALAEWQQRLRIAVIASGDPGRNRAKAAEHALRLVLLQTGREVAEAYRATGTPMAVLIADGRIASPTVAGAKAVAQLAQQAAGAALGRPRELGEAVPQLVLKDLDGEPVALAGGERTLLIFWSPRCEHSQKMVRGLRELAREPLAGAPELVLISDGDAEEVRAQELGWPVLLDPDHRARAAFGARGTPMAVVVDNGRIASPLVAGPAPVFDLLGAVTLAAR